MSVVATKGPWEILPDPREDNVFISDGRVPIAALYHQMDSDGETDHRMANARLIAIAPEMRDLLLKGALDIADDRAYEDWQVEVSQLLSRLKPQKPEEASDPLDAALDRAADEGDQSGSGEAP